ncbi:MAG: excinuclease ABC subunit UvrC [Bacillota bacterium]|jgi:excinuclease ABC subunit C|nr:excinuclease ABC subunit UvrC [Bacillota bacterium]
MELVPVCDPARVGKGWVEEVMEAKAELKKELELVPERPGVYLFRSQSGTVIYVGKAVSLRNRLRSYFQAKGHPERIRRLLLEAARFEYIVTDSEVEALVLECNLIKEYRPKFNINLKDDKSYPYLRVTAEEFPRVMITRNLVRDGSRYFGPYPDVNAVKEAVNLLRKLFPFRSCPDKNLAPRGRPCLNGQIKNCLAPCTGGVSSGDYREMIEQLVLFLEGRRREVEKRLAAQMEEAAGRWDFERAAALRNQLAALKKFREQQRVARAAGRDEDVLAVGTFLDEVCVLLFRLRGGKLVAEEHYFLTEAGGLQPGEILASFMKQYYHAGREIPAVLLVSAPLPESELLAAWLGRERGSKVVIRFPRRGRGRELLQLALENATLYARQRKKRALAYQEKGRLLALELQKALDLGAPPRRLECVDISHFGGRETVGSLIRFTDGQPDRKGYRRYRIRGDVAGDDYAALREVLRRRLGRTGKEPLPDLLVIDGGKGQLHAALAVLRETGCTGVELVALAKEEEEIFRPGSRTALSLPPSHPGLHLLQQARDEAHRFARAYQERLRSSKATASLLGEVRGIGKKRQEALLRHFGSLARLRAASFGELAAVPGMNKKAAEALHEFLHGAGMGEDWGKQCGKR